MCLAKENNLIFQVLYCADEFIQLISQFLAVPAAFSSVGVESCGGFL